MPIGQIPWNKGKTGVYLEETLEKMRNAKLGKSLSKEHKMKISEVYARYYKKRNHISIEDWKIQRSEVFKQYGWEIVYFNEIEVNEENILNKLNKVKK